MARTTPIVAVILATLLALSPVGVAAGGGPAPAATTADDGIDRGAVETAPPDNDSSVNVSVGQQLSTVVSVTDDEIQGDFEQTELEVELESESESERAEAIAERAEELRDRAETIREEYRDAVEAYREGELTRSEFAQRLAVLNSRAERVLEGYGSLQDRAANVSDLELRSAGLNRSAVRGAVSDLDSVTGTGPDALLARFTGQTDGEVEIENDSGLSIAVESEDGERSREIERPGDGDANLTIDASEALSVARGSLTETNGTWTVETLTVDAEDGIYGFEFELVGDGLEGDAEIGVDGSSGDVVTLEEEIEVERDDEDEEDEGDEEESDEEGSDEEESDDDSEESDEEESDDDSEESNEEESDEQADGDDEESDEEGSNEEESDEEDAEDEESDGEAEDDEVQRELVLLPVAGDAAPNETVTVRALLDGEPVSNLTVTMNYETVGTTDENGELTVTLPDGDATLRAESDNESVEAEAETAYEFGDADEQREREDEERFLEAFEVNASLDNGTVALTVAYEGSPVADATVYEDGDAVGTTDENGTLTFDTDATEELELTVERGALVVELAYVVDGDSLTLEEAEVDVDDDEREQEGDDEGSDDDGADEEEEEDDDDSDDGDDDDDDDDEEEESDDDSDDTDD